jgi:hypothetical protein
MPINLKLRTDGGTVATSDQLENFKAAVERIEKFEPQSSNQ